MFSDAKVWLTQALFLALLLVIIFPGVFSRGEVIGPGDILFQAPPWEQYAPADFAGPQNRLMSDVVTAFYPYYALTTQALDEGHWPLWNPLEYAGMPLLANCQTAVFYPPRLLHSFFELHLATTLYILLKLWLCGMTAFLCARGLGMRGGFDRFFSVAWMLASYNIIWANWSLPDVSVWLPVLFLGVERILAQEYRPGFFAVALGGSMLLLAGHPETALGMGLGLGVYFVARLAIGMADGEAILRPIAVCVGAWLLALAVSAIQILPFAEYLLHSATFFDRAAEPLESWYPPSAIATLWVPRFFGLIGEGTFFGELDSNRYGMLYPGIAVWLGVFLLPFVLPGKGSERARIFALAIAAGYALLMGFRVPPFDLLHRLPVINTMHGGYHAVFALFALPLLATMGLQQWCQRRTSTPTDLWRVLPGLAIAALAVGAVLQFFWRYLALKDGLTLVLSEVGMAALLVVVGLGLLLIARLPKARPAAALLLTLFIAGDLAYANRGVNPTLPREDMFPKTALTDHLLSLGHPARISAGEGGIASGLLAPYGIEDWLAYDGLYPERMVTFQSELGPEVWNAMEPLCAKTWYLHRPGFPPLFPLEERPEQFMREGEYDGLEIYRNVAAQPRAFLVPGLEVFETRDAIFATMRAEDGQYNPMARVAVLREDLPQDDVLHARIGQTEEVTGGATIQHYSSGEVIVDYTADHDGMLVLADAWYPGWKAEVDGVPTPVVPAYYTFRGVAVPGGAHTVRFHYAPTSFYLGLGISVAALLLGGAAGVLLLVRRKRHT